MKRIGLMLAGFGLLSHRVDGARWREIAAKPPSNSTVERCPSSMAARL